MISQQYQGSATPFPNIFLSISFNSLNICLKSNSNFKIQKSRRRSKSSREAKSSDDAESGSNKEAEVDINPSADEVVADDNSAADKASAVEKETVEVSVAVNPKKSSTGIKSSQVNIIQISNLGPIV